MNVLEFDIGNSRIKWRFLEPGQNRITAQSTAKTVEELLASSLTTLSPDLIRVANVRADDSLALLTDFSLEKWQIQPVIAQVSQECGGVRNGYGDISRLGVDRWLAMLAAHAHNEGALCVIDAGTAVTVDLVSAEGVHEGGYILPGADLMRRALSNETGRIDVNALEAPAIVPGTNTQACVTAGSGRAVVGAVESTMAEYPGHRPLLTGGSAGTLRDFGLVATHNPDLVMEGLRLWLSQALDDQSP